MATVYVAYGKAGPRGDFDVLQCVSGAPTSSEVVSSSGTATSTSEAAAVKGVAMIFCDVPVYASIEGVAPASAARGWYVPANIAYPIGVDSGDRISLIDV